VTCFVGPEGGWTAPEIIMLETAGCALVSLSPNTLRFETAALALAVLVQHRREESGRISNPPIP
jgi:16S rRNA (uracil1498-N3)-methyltransferase